MRFRSIEGSETSNARDFVFGQQGCSLARERAANFSASSVVGPQKQAQNRKVGDILE